MGTGKNPTNHLYSDTKKLKCFQQKKIEITKKEHALKGYASTSNVEIFNSANPELQLKRY